VDHGAVAPRGVRDGGAAVSTVVDPVRETAPPQSLPPLRHLFRPSLRERLRAALLKQPHRIRPGDHTFCGLVYRGPSAASGEAAHITERTCVVCIELARAEGYRV